MTTDASTVRYLTERPSPRTIFRHVVAYSIITLLSLLLAGPMAYMVLSSFNTEIGLSASLNPIPRAFQWQNYVDAVTLQTLFPRYVLNSVFLATGSAVLTTLSSSMAGYAFARIEAPGRGPLFGLVRAMLMLPSMALTIPQYLLYARLGFVDTYWPWIVGSATGSAFHIFLFRQFFLNFPRELEDAAEVDGAGAFRTYAQIFLPNALPAVSTVFIFTWGGIWGDWFTPQLYLIHDERQLIAARLTTYNDAYGNPLVTVQMAAAVIYTLPLIVMFFVAQKYILKGVVTSGIKG